MGLAYNNNSFLFLLSLCHVIAAFLNSSNIIIYFSPSVVVALCPNNNEVHIYRLVEDKWEKVHVLQKVLC